MTIHRSPALLALGAVFLLCGCREHAGEAQPKPAVSSMPAVAGAPAVAELRSATYSGLGEPAGPVTLSDGVWAGAPHETGAAARPVVSLAPGFRVTGDLDGDGTEEAVVLLARSAGGSGTFDYLAVMKRKGTGIENIATATLGDRVQIRSARIDSGRLLVSTVQAGAGDAACCPGDLADRTWTWAGNTLTESSSAGPAGRLSLATLAGTEWILRAWDVDEPAPAEVEVTLTYENGHFAGKSGCNRYTGAATTGSVPGEMSVGPTAGTRMACPEPQSLVEARFLKQLGGANKFGFFVGQLAISYTKDGGTPGTMLFTARAPR